MALNAATLGILDWALAGVLIVLVPARALWRSVAARRRGETGTEQSKYLASTLEPLGLLACLIAIWAVQNRRFSTLGLEWPISLKGWIALGVAVALLSAILLATLLQKRVTSSPAVEAGREILPQTRAELWPFILFTLSVGVSWEMLYRGFLFGALAPSTGIGGAIAISSLAYALAHRYRNMRSLVGSLAAALAFGTAFAATGSLWWLIVLHAGLPLVAALAVKVSYDHAAAK